MRSALRRMALGVVLLTPVLLFYAAHYWGADADRVPTGFIAYDMPSYLAFGREHFDRGGFSLTYGNPYSFRADTARIHCQPHLFLLGTITYLLNLDPGTVFVAFGLLCGVLTIGACIVLFEQVYGLTSPEQRWTFICFLWGGGVLVAAGTARCLARGWAGCDVFALDPSWGWWFLNFGRNLVYPTEAFYHLLVVLLMICVVRNEMGKALALLAVLGLSHPFTGVQYGLIGMVWLLGETYYVRNPAIPRRAALVSVAIVAVLLCYYLVLLPLDDEHRSLRDQCALPWRIDLSNMLPAWILVALLVAWQVRTPRLLAALLADPFRRFLAVGFLVSFALVNHHCFIRPVQPAHFTRGHIWTPLFLLGAPALIGIFRCLQTRFRPWLAVTLSLLLVAGFTLDNSTWFIARARGLPGHSLRADQWATLKWLKANATSDHLLLADDELLSMLAPTYCSARVWVGHQLTTPYYSQRHDELQRFFAQGELQPRWLVEDLLILHSAPGFTEPQVADLRRRGLELREVYRVGQLVMYAGRGRAVR